MRYRIEIDPDRCLANGDCADVAPAVFTIGEIAEVTGTAEADVLLAAAEACPAHAISLIDIATGRQVHP